MNALPKSRLVKVLLPVLLTILVGFQMGLALHDAAHAAEHTDHDTGCFLCCVAGQFTAIEPETPILAPAAVAQPLYRPLNASTAVRPHRPAPIRGPPLLFA